MKVMRAISPIVSAMILLAASIAAGIIVYQYFIKTVNVMAEKPVVYFTAQYVPEISKVFVTVNNGWTKTIEVYNVTYTCQNGETSLAKLSSPLKVRPGEAKTFDVSIENTCTPLVIIVHYTVEGGKLVYSSEPVEVQ